MQAAALSFLLPAWLSLSVFYLAFEDKELGKFQMSKQQAQKERE
jgi:hypothetical protein